MPITDRTDPGKILAGEFLLRLIGGDKGLLRPSDLCEFLNGIGVILSQNDLDIGIFNYLLLERGVTAHDEVPERLVKQHDPEPGGAGLVQEIDEIRIKKAGRVVHEHGEEMPLGSQHFGLDITRNGPDILQNHTAHALRRVPVPLQIELEINDLVFFVDLQKINLGCCCVHIL